MGTVATLAVNVIANTGGLTKGFDKAKKEAKGFGASFGASMKRFVTPAAVATAAIAAVGVSVFKISSALTRLDVVAKKAASLGIKGQELMEFQHAASLAGVEAESFTRAMMDMQKNIGDAIAGTGEAKDALAMLGLEIGDLARLDASEQFLEIADKISKIENAAERAAVAARVFGGAGADLIPMFVQGAAAIREQMDELERLQGGLTDLEFDQASDAVDAMTKLGTTWDGIWNQAAVEVAPVLTDLVEILQFALQLAKDIGGEFVGYLKYLNPLGALFAAKDVFDWATDADAKRAADAVDREQKLETHEKLMADTKAQMAMQIKAEMELLKIREALEAKGVSLLQSLRTPMEMYTDTIADLNLMLGEGVIEWETYSRAVEKAQKNVRDLEKFEAKEIMVAERQSVGAAIRGQAGTFSIQQKQQRALEKIREEERLQTRQLKQQTEILRQVNNKLSVGVVVGI